MSVVVRIAVVLAAGAPLVAQTVRIEPDDYAEGTVLETIHPGVTLWTTLDDNVPIPIFDVTATTDSFGYAPTGAKVFANTGVTHWWDQRRLRMDFSIPVQSVQIAFAGGDFFDDEIGRLRAYDLNNNLIGEYVTAPRPEGSAETMSITRPQADIAWASAFCLVDEGDFGRLDDLRFSAAPPLTRGDTNCDGAINFFDIDPFVVAVVAPDLYDDLYPDCNILTADVSQDGLVDFFDIDPFLALLFP